MTRIASFPLALLSALFALPVFAQEGPSPTAEQSTGSLVLNTFLQYGLPPIITATAGIIVWALKKLSDLLHAKAEGSKVAQALVTGTDFVGAAVSHVVSGLAPDVREALANNGTIDEAERAALKAKAVALLKAELPDGIKTVLGSVMQGGLDTWLSGKAEQAISLVAAQAATTAAAVPSSP